MKQLKITILIFFAIFFILVCSNAWAAGLNLSLDTFSIRFLTPTERSLDDGYIEKDSRINVHAVRVRINGGNKDQIWKLYVRADDNMFSPGVYAKGSTDLKWKFDHENANSYRRVRAYNQLVVSGSGVANATKYIDLRMLMDWSDPPANYSLRLTFTLKAE